MASNFRIAMHHNGRTLHFKLLGDFDGTSAHQLLNGLKKPYRGISRVIIYTDSLRKIHAFGRDVFQSRFYELNGLSHALVRIPDGGRARPASVVMDMALHLHGKDVFPAADNPVRSTR